MNYVQKCVFALLIWANVAIGQTTNPIPDQLLITQRWLSLSTAFDVTHTTTNLGILYRRIVQLMLTYELFDNTNQRIALVLPTFFPVTVHFDIYDNDNKLLGAVEDVLFTFFPSFTMFGQIKNDLTVRAIMNFWGTSFTLIDPQSERPFARMTRPLIRNNNDWTFEVTNRVLFERKNLNTKVLLTAISSQGDRDYWERNSNFIAPQANTDINQVVPNPNQELLAPTIADVSKALVDSLLTQVNYLIVQYGFVFNEIPSPQVLEATATELEINYLRTVDPNDLTRTSFDRFQSFTNYLLDTVASDSTTRTQKYVILFLLKLRLQAGLI